MTRHPQQPPSAIDGYRRLASRRSAPVTGHVTAKVGRVSASEQNRTGAVRRTGRRLRLVAFVAMLVLAAGVTASLALADEPAVVQRAAEQHRLPADATTAATTTPVATTVRSTRATKVAPADEDATTSYDEPTTTLAATATEGVSPRGAALPLTGDTLVLQMLRGGAVLVLLGMLVQAAGQPLPARSTAR